MSTVHPWYPGSGSGSSSSGVTSVNGETGDVLVTAQEIGAQPESSVLTDISSVVMPNNSLLMVNNSGTFQAASCMPAGVAWLGYTTVDQQKAHLAYSYDELADLPTLFSGSYTDLSSKPILFSGAYSDLTGKPVLFSGAYTDLTGKPTIPAAQIQSDWNQANTSSLDYIKNKPSIPSGQVNSDWNSVSGLSQILNKPVLFDGTYASLTGKPTTFTPSAHTHVIGDVTGLQTALDGKFTTPTGTALQYLRGNGTLATFPTTVSSFTNDAGYLTSVSYPVTSVNTKTGAVVLSTTDIAEGTNLYYTTARLATYLAANGYRKVETFLGTTDASGNYTITFASTYSTPPDIQPQIVGGLFTQFIRVVSVSTTGCVVQAAQRNTVNLLATELLLGTTVALVGASVSVQVTPRA